MSVAGERDLYKRSLDSIRKIANIGQSDKDQAVNALTSITEIIELVNPGDDPEPVLPEKVETKVKRA